MWIAPSLAHLLLSKPMLWAPFTLLEAFRQWWSQADQPDNYRFLHVSTDEVYGSLAPEDPAFR